MVNKLKPANPDACSNFFYPLNLRVYFHYKKNSHTLNLKLIIKRKIINFISLLLSI